MKKELFNALDYRNGLCSHDEYYSQFLNTKLIDYVKNVIGEDLIKNSTNPHFNDIPLVKWDRLNVRIFLNVKLYKQLHNVTYPAHNADDFLWSSSQNVCIAKSAAKKIRGF